MEKQFLDVNLRWLFAGSALSILGDQFSVIAIPWLVLKLTGDPFQLGLVTALLGGMKVVFAVPAGWVAGRFPPPSIVLITKILSCLVLTTLSWVIFHDRLGIWGLYGLVSCLGLISAFGMPASISILPLAVSGEALPRFNSLFSSMGQISALLGLFFGGGLVVAFDSQDPLRGLACALLVDAGSFAISAWTISKVKIRNVRPAGGRASAHQSFGSVLSLFRTDKSLLAMILFVMLINLLIAGPIQVAIPLLASYRFNGQASSFVIILAAQMVGVIAGLTVRAKYRTLGSRRLGLSISMNHFFLGLLFIAIGLSPWLIEVALAFALAGALGGYLQVSVITWLQTRVGPAQLGGLMSVWSAIIFGLPPISTLAAGFALKGGGDPTELLLAAGGFLSVLSIVFALIPSFKAVTYGDIAAAKT